VRNDERSVFGLAWVGDRRCAGSLDGTAALSRLVPDCVHTDLPLHLRADVGCDPAIADRLHVLADADTACFGNRGRGLGRDHDRVARSL